MASQGRWDRPGGRGPGPTPEERIAMHTLMGVSGVTDDGEAWGRLQVKAAEWGLSVHETANRLYAATVANLAPEW